MRILFISCLLWTILFTRQVKGESKCLRTNRQPDRMCVTKCDPLTGCRAEEKCLCDGDCGYSCVKRDLSCGRPPRVSNARPQYPATNFSSVVTYVCNEGHTLSGAAKRTCRANGRWDGVGPNCLKMCSLPTIPFSTYIAKPVNYTRTYRTGERITLACKKGFKKKPGGNPVRICISGLWTRFPFQCEGTHACKRTIRAPRTKCTLECSPQSGCGSDKYKCLCDGSCGFSCVEIGMSCGNPPSISNGNLVYNNTSYNSTAHYSCNEGYNLNTAPVKRCTAKKRWEGLTPRCLKDCKPPTIPRNANISNPSKKYHSGYKVTFKCNEGYNQEGMATQMCFLGSWTVLPFKCTEGGCGDPGTPENGRKLGVTYSVNSKVYFDCDLGYELEGSADRKCQLNGTWTGIQPVCKVVNCGFPPRPKNGTFIGNETTFRSELEFRCDEGFELQGSAKRMCTTDKSWTGKEVTCNAVDCGSLDPPKNGSLIVKETTYPNHAEIRCDEGFTLLGPRRRTCQANGTWSGNITECKAVDCGALSVPTNGSSIGTETKFPNKIRFRCDTGFDLVGSSVRMCMADKSWNGVKTVCKAVDCGKLPHPTNGSVIGKETTFPNEVEISCDKGFILRGSHRRKCKADRNWSGDTTVCEAINCGKPTLPDHGSVSGVSTRYPHSITFTCIIGYEIYGSVVRRCQANGTWSGSKTTCKPVDCGLLQRPNNGTKVGNKTTFLNEVSFFCNKGFYMLGSSKRTCQADKQWSGVKTFCRAVDCGSLIVPKNGSKLGQETTYPNFIKFSCDEGFILLGSTVRTCLANGSWSGMQTLCQAKDCGPIQAPRNGTKHGSQTTYLNKILFTCDNGFNLIGSNERQCTSDGVWSGAETLCEAKDCGPIRTPINGTKHGTKTTYPSRVTVTCNSGFHLRGSSERECMSDGVWSGVEAYCEAKDCGSLEIPTNGSLVGLTLTTFPNSLTFACDDGFELKGSVVRYCQANALWSGNKTFCQAKDCGPIESPTNGSLFFGDRTTYPHIVLFSCDKGFLLKGSNLRRCTSEGVWSGMPASCEARDCGPLPFLLNGTAIGQRTVYPNEIIFNCDAGFNLVGSRIRRCQSTGIWSGKQTSCQAKDCGPLALPLNGSSFGRDTTFPNVISFYCDVGFIMIGTQTRKCQANGKWSGNETTCRAVECGSLAMPTNGSTYGELTTYPNKVYFNCVEGFVLQGSSIRVCMANGSWSGTETLCEAINCGELAVPQNGTLQGSATTFPNGVDFSCDEGFVLEGSDFRRCQANGTWSGGITYCRAKDCGKLPFPMNGSVFGSQTTFPNKLQFSCDNGFDLIGSTVRRCEADGMWSGQQTACQAVDCGPLPLLLNGTYLGNLTTYPNEVLSFCDEGFLLGGSARRFCQANRTWSGIQTTCAAVDCGPLPILINGSSYGSLTYFPNSIQFSCDSGFLLRGSSGRSCLPTGLWSGSNTTCEAIDCGTLAVPMNGSFKGTRTYFPNVLQFSCDEGFILGGATERQCLADGSWSGNDTSCKAVDCGPLPVPRNGSSHGDMIVYPNSVWFSCDAGFFLKGSSRRMCQANGTWSGSLANCNPVECGQVTAPANGSVRGNYTTFPNKLHFYCDDGFILSGSFIRRCTETGTWSGEQTVCIAKDCGLLRTPQNGSMLGTETTFPNVVTFTCDEGFLMDGPNRRRCQNDGTWSGNETICAAIDCGKLKSPKNGSLHGERTVFPESLRFSCDIGFVMGGSPVRQCQPNGTWNGTETTCSAIDCGRPPTPLNGSVYGDKTTYPNIWHFSCDEGFTQHGSTERKCQPNGTWSGKSTFCQANDCGNLSVPQNGSLFGSETTFPNVITFSCDEGFILKGSKVRKCQANKTWTGNTTYCDAVDCGSLDSPMNGSFFGNLTVFPNSVRFDCDAGFILSGSSVRTCQSNGIWSGYETKCSAIDCGPLPVPQNGSLLGKMTVYPSILQFSCDEGFTLHGSSYRKCQTNGAWSGNSSFCKENDCGPLSVPMNGTSFGNLTTFPNEISFTCDEGFILHGSVLRQCQANKLWSGNDTFCEAVDCGHLDSPKNGSLSGDSTVFPSSLQFQCDLGFILKGSRIRKCQANGTWHGFKTSCHAIDCGQPQAPHNGSMIGKNTTYPNMLLFTCDVGFTLVGAVVRKCQANGTWSGTDALCQAKDCGELVTPTNGSSFGNLTTYPHEKIFSCDEGFILRGSRTRQCLPSGNWSGNTTICVAKDCGPLPVPLNGSLFGEKTTYPNQITFSCDDGFVQRGSVVRRCRSNGTWSGDTTFCKAKDCGPLLAPVNGSSSGKLFTFPNIVSFRCDEGFILKGSEVRKCQANGVWTGNDTICEAVDCGVLSSPLNGSSSGNRTVYPNSVRLWCDSGFVLHGSWLRTCQSNGKWDGNETICEAIDCGELMTPQNGTMFGKVTTYPNILRFNCDEGFILTGSSVRKCGSNGTWSGNETKCQAKDCGPLAVPVNGSSIGDLTVFPHKVVFNCDEGFLLSGSHIRVCQANGTWSGNQTFCQAVDCGPLSVPANGSSLGAATVFPNSQHFICDPGFILNGSALRTCQPNGTWSGFTTTCSAVDCGRPQPLRNGSVIGENTVYPNFVIHNCDEGFILRGPAKIKCQTNGTWSQTDSFCEAKDCGNLSKPLNGSMTGLETTFPNKVSFNCDEGFILSGSSVRYCQSNGSWSGTETTCTAVDCGNPQPLQNGSIVGNKTVYPNSVTHRCNEGFILHGSSRITCQTNGTWSKTSSYCEARNCGVLDIPVNGSTTGSKTTYPSKLYFSCDDGFILRGSTIRQCLADGNWSGNDTSCEAIDCGPLLVPVNGSSSGNFTVFPNSVIFKCDPGFNLYGSPMRMCRANGTWSGKAVSCAAKDCGPLAAPTNGSSTGELTFFPNEIVFDCDKGFLLKGSSIRHCQTNGNWSGNQTFCKAVDCGLLSNPMNGSSSGDSTVFPNSVQFDCDSGFILSGPHERKCLANGSWSGFPTVCSAVDCGPLSAPKNGSSTGNLTVFPNSVAFNCDPGFLLNGSATRKCQANGTWSGLQAVCNAIDCGMPQPLQNGTVIGEFTVYPNFVTHVCDEGFVLRGPPKIKCQTNGTWSKSSTFCEAKDCGAPVVPVNGSATGQKTTFPNEVTFSCDEGFILNGSTVRRCQANGSWSGVQTSCRAVDCGPLSAPKNGSFVGDSTVFPNSLLFACNLGFILDGSYRRTCQANGTWDGLETVCIAKDCGALEIPANGSLHGDLTSFPNKVDFSCDQGFLLSGSQTRRCQGNGTWSGIQTYCEAVDCGPLYVPMNGSASGNSTVFPNSVQFSCDPGFILNGSAVRTCQPHGTWNGTKTVCVAVDCGPLPVPTNGSSSGDSTVFPNAIQFSCDPGFILSGSASRMCQTNGTWSGFSTECSAIDCGWPEPLQNGSIIGKFTVYPNSVRHICDKGFVLRGSPEIKCQANGTWSKTSSFCEAKDCGALEVPLNGSITGRETTFPNEAILSCDVGFILHGSSFRRCQANGTWSGTKTVCKAVDCGSLSAPRNGSSLGNFTVFPNELLFYCDPGFLLGGSSTRTCQANGTWSGIETICTPVDCGPLRPLQYGSYNGTSTVFPNVVNAVCDMGFILRGSSRIKCQVNGTWSSNDTFCDAKDCGNLPRPLNGSVIGDKTTYPSEVEFECDAGFNLQGSTIRRCEADGQWSGVEVKCRAVDCGRLAIPEHGFAHGNSTTYPNTITFSCNTGFSLHGTSSRTCQADGTWTSGKTRCQGEDCGKLLPPENGWMFGSDTSHPSKVLFSCASGYSTVGSSQRTCLRNGSWSGQQPRCLPRWCSQAPDVPAFAYQTWTAKNKRYEDGERIYYSCKAGLMMVGIPMRKCVKGRWTKANFRCSAPSCDAPPVPKFAYLTWARGARSKYLNGETAYYSCQAGYELIGIPYIECKDSGWTKIDFSCKAVDCGFLESPPNGGIAKKTGKTFGAIYVFECDEDKGYLMDGSKERRCQADATWSGVQPLCKLQSCVTPSKPMHGKFKSEPRSKYYFENIVGYQCDSGYSLRGHERTKCLIHGNWSHAAPTCTGCSKPLGLKSRMIFSRQLSASSERDSRHSARHGRLDGNSAWCSARSSFAKYFQIDFGRTVEVTSVATQGHPREEKWIQRYILRYSLGKNWFTYQASGRDKVFKGNRDGRSAVRHYLKERLVAKKLRIVRHENSRDFMGSTVCLRAEVYGCSFDTECLTFGSEVFAHWNSIKKHTRYIHGYVTKVHRTSVHISPSGKHGGNADSIFELPREKEFYVIKDEKSSPQEIKIGSDVIVASEDKVGFSQGKVTQKYYSWYGVELGNGKTVWGTADEIRLLKRPIYCEKEYITA